MEYVRPKSGKVLVWTDGACGGNRIGGWAYVLLDGKEGKWVERSGWERGTTNQRMELKAALEALRKTNPGSSVVVHSDSAYLVNCFKQGWWVKWRKNGWRNSEGKPVANQDLWEALVRAAACRDVEFLKVKGHSGNEMNDRCDDMAVVASKGNGTVDFVGEWRAPKLILT